MTRTKTLLDAIYDKYNEINEYCAECLAAAAAASSSNDQQQQTQSQSTENHHHHEHSASSPVLSSPSSSSDSQSNSPTTTTPPPPPNVVNSSTTTVATTPERVSFYIPSAYTGSLSPKSSRNETSSSIKLSISLIMSGLGLRQIGNVNELASLCDHVLELDLSKNDFDNWSEVKYI